MTESYKRKLQYLDNPKLSLEIFDSLIGDFIGSGCSRDVYEYPANKNFVVKVETGHASGDNMIEWKIWEAVKRTKNAKWFAPCEWISSNGSILLQRKTTPIYKKSLPVPDRIPWFFTDVKESNFGWIGKQLVAHDYAFTLDMSVSNEAAKEKIKMQSTKNKL